MEQKSAERDGGAATSCRVSNLYLHIPFCRSKCPYCSFVSEVGRESEHERYVRALLIELERELRPFHQQPLESLFIGGGTPTVLGSGLLEKLLERCRSWFGFSAGAEITVETNPGTISAGMCERLAAMGVNRLSIGAQSLVATELEALGRGHGPAEVYELIRWVRAAGIEQFSIDLMYGIPGQSRESWSYSLEEVAAIRPEHLSLYQLTLEEGTPYFEQVASGQLELPPEALILDLDELTETWCADHGYERYEISNYCLPGSRCRHNLVYWQNRSYLACGAAAVSYLEGRRSRRWGDPRAYCRALERGESSIESSEQLEPIRRYRETVVLGLRLLEGVCDRELEDRFGFRLDQVYGTVLDELSDTGLIEREGTRLRLSARGLRLANRVMAALV